MKYLIVLFTVSIIACSNETSNSALIGDWTGISWKVDGQESERNAEEVKFAFEADNSYSAAFSQQQEEGTFRLSGYKLYTTAKRKAEKMVEIRFQGTDTLIMDMNRMGTLEELVLVRD